MFITPTLDEIRQTILRDYQSLNNGIDISEDSDTYARASALAGAAEGLYAHQKWIIRQFFPDTADSEFLEKHAGLRGLRRKIATYASGKGVEVTGNVGAVIPTGLQIKTTDNKFYATTETVILDDSGIATVAVRALTPGASQNITSATSAEFMAAPAGIRTAVTINNIVGGTDAETDAALLERLLEKIRRPAAGGNRYDYRNWALEVDGVERAYVYPLRRGNGTVDIAITAGNTEVSEDTLATCQTYINDVRPVTAKSSYVVKPDIVKIDIDMAIKAETNTDDVVDAIKTNLTKFFDEFEPGSNLILSQLEAVVSDTPKIIDRKINYPKNNLNANITTKIEWFRLGNVSVSTLES